jgi:hypothetical protein
VLSFELVLDNSEPRIQNSKISSLARLPLPNGTQLTRSQPSAKNTSTWLRRDRQLDQTGPAFSRGNETDTRPDRRTLAVMPNCGSCPIQSTQDSGGRLCRIDRRRLGGASGKSSSKFASGTRHDMSQLHVEPVQPCTHLGPALSQREIPIRPFPFISSRSTAMPYCNNTQSIIPYLVPIRLMMTATAPIDMPQRRAQPPGDRPTNANLCLNLTFTWLIAKALERHPSSPPTKFK